MGMLTDLIEKGEVKKDYRLSDLANLRSKLVNAVGEVIADKWIEQRFNRNVSYGLPRIKGDDGKIHNTGYGRLMNLDAYPERYIKDIPVTIVPDEKWTSSAGGEFSWLGGVRMPVSQKLISHPQEHVLTHEQQHYIDAISSRNPRNIYPTDELNFRGILEQKNQIPSFANTKRDSIGEIMPELLDYESRLPAGRGITSTDFWKGLSNEQKALIIRKLQPMPEGVDAMTGVVR